MNREKNIALRLEYDGSSFAGYQIQPDKRTVQGILEESLQKLFKKKIKTSCSGRTDRGVHALNQVVNFKVKSFLDLNKIKNFLNKMFPDDIKLKSIEYASDSFHSRVSALSRVYKYRISFQEKSTFNARYFAFCKDLKIEEFKREMKKFVGKHNFKYFSTRIPKGHPEVKEIYEISFSEREYFEITIIGNSFLRGMIRIMIGTALAVIENKLPRDFISEALKDPDKKERKIKAPPSGLYFYNTNY